MKRLYVIHIHTSYVFISHHNHIERTTGMKYSHRSCRFFSKVRCRTSSAGRAIAAANSALKEGYANRIYVR